MAKFKILLVDDDEVILQSVGRELEQEGFEVLRCSSFKVAQAKLRDPAERFDLAVLDLKLGEPPLHRGGLMLAEEIDGTIPVIILSGDPDRASVLDALNLRKGGRAAASVILKGEGPESLFEAIAAALVHRVFVVHGHHEGALGDAVVCLKAFGLAPIVLREMAGEGRAIVESIEHYSNVSFAVVVLTPDDWGAEYGQSDLRPRARQNVILEWGFFVGRLGRKRVAALFKPEDGKTLDFPSDYGGVLCIPMDTEGKWRSKLAHELRGAGVPVEAA